MIDNKGLKKEPWFTPTLTSKGSLIEEPTLTPVLVLWNKACTVLTSILGTPSLRMAHQSTVRGTLSKVQSLVLCQVLRLQLFDYEDCICSTSSRHETKLHVVYIDTTCFGLGSQRPAPAPSLRGQAVYGPYSSPDLLHHLYLYSS